ncbi:acyl carrier protein phosphodiesterase [Mangrovibacterium diazotrophicum]|uniref:Acyl carrier protein phosphodiesterase n=1 Tax=Mangrovibacterium diazotrophicum TaxID=1261403 RepID=A0A419VVI4_9BACT|nr:ACP phosphodiesterase [Mangrovibacterium diazotrophicum]RKD86180.1 acyl carrier protein phosphodiesterase [Mangrovibacterium diazotrophicum]
MNYLAHLYLSGESDEMMLGNFIGDYVKGQQYLRYSEDVQKGILLHRAIDSFTDTHPVVKEAADFFRPAYGRYSGIVTDVIFDHFLAKYWREYSPYTLRQFAKHVHAVLLSNFFQLPNRVKGFLPFLIQHKRLESYAQLDGIQQSLHIMAHRTSLPDHTNEAIAVLERNFAELKELFERFFEELVLHAEQRFDVNILKKVK